MGKRLAIFVIIMYANRKTVQEGQIIIIFLSLMLIESFIWCGGLIMLMGISENLILAVLERNIVPEQFYLAIGAGIWEELLFRVGLIGMLIYLMENFLGYSQLFASLVAVIIGAFFFSYFHYIGELGDIFTFKSFSLRAIAGVFLGSLYIFRGFGITAYTHIFYDM